ncbi:MAG: hypothetical protein AVDCRST_MAG30-3005 [uncultured Solirubrobacteraceae bacterium]|uniref:Transaldolase n=1 Tax=uncultured Solirubrobacteraceae bacterium TaxID=1162706 RepID=A0A6J4TD45_9ACTN|nr:MAG: hypothetical protein AVDCRST_MAG30-3005 [uncultured Solirubrobacteraceae bacterium]
MTITLPLTALFDDASQFPPAALPLDAAVAGHEAWRGGSRSELVGRFLAPLARIGDVAASAGARDWELGIVVPKDVGSGSAAKAALALGDTALRVTAVEMPAATGPALAAEWRDAFPEARLFLEGTAADVADARAQDAGAKIRCGGTTPGAVPSVEAVADFVEGCAGLDVPFKATAGLHQPLRHRDAATGDEQFGFLNLWVATALALEQAPTDDVRRALTAKDLDTLAPDTADLQGARRIFTGFGTCSIQEPIDALIDLELLHA